MVEISKKPNPCPLCGHPLSLVLDHPWCRNCNINPDTIVYQQDPGELPTVPEMTEDVSL